MSLRDDLKKALNNGIEKWYLQTWFIVTLFCFWPLVLPAVAGAVLVALQQIELQRLNDERHSIESASSYKTMVDEESTKIISNLLERSLELKNKENYLIESVKANAAILLKNDLDNTIQQCADLQAETQEECDIIRRKVENECNEMKNTAKLECDSLKKEALKIMSTANREYLEIKAKADKEYCRILDEANQKAKKEINDAEKYKEIVQKRWSIIESFSKEQYKAIVLNTASMLHTIDEMANGHDFEYYFANIIQNSGYENVIVTKASGDMGVDVLAEKDGLKYAIQCKRYNQQVDVAAVQQAATGREYYRCNIAVVVTNNYLTRNAINLANNTQVVIWDRKELHKLLLQYSKIKYIQEYSE